MISQKKWTIGTLLALSIGLSGCSSQPDYCEGITGAKAMENLYYIKDNSMKVKTAKMMNAVKLMCQQDTSRVKDKQATNTSSDYEACFVDKLVGCGFPDNAVKALTENIDLDR